MKQIENKLQYISRYLGLACLVVLFIYIVIYTNFEISDPDIWLHLKTGESILNNRAIPRVDPFSFTLKQKPWIDHEWLFQVITYLAYHYFGATGIIFIQSFLISFLFIMLLFFGYRRDNHLIIFAALLITLYASRTRINIRPDIFSVLFFIITIFILKKYLNTKLIYLLIPLQLLWANIHGYFILGPLTILIVLLGEFIQTKLPFHNKEAGSSKIFKIKFSRLALLFFLLFGVSFLNPYTYKGALYPIGILFGSLTKSKIFFGKIVELISPIVLYKQYNIDFFFYFCLIFFSLATFVLNWRRIKISDLLIWLLLLIFSLRLSRNVMFFSLFSGAVCIENMNDIDAAIFKKRLNRPGGGKNKTIYLVDAVFKILLIFWISNIAVNYIFYSGYYLFDKYEMKGKLWGFSERDYAAKAVDFVQKNNFPPRLFNDFNSGSYLIGRCYPGRKVFIDGRTELYGPGFFSEYEKVMRADKSAIDRVNQKYVLDGFFITGVPSSFNNIIKYLYNNKEYKTVYFDDKAIIFLKDKPSNQDLINKFAFDLRDWKAPEVDLLKIGPLNVNPYPYVRRAQLLEMLKLDDAVSSEITQIERVIPGSFIYYSYMGEILYRKKKFLEAFQHFRLALLLLPRNTNMQIYLASCYAELGNIDRAISDLKSILKQGPKNHEALYRLGMVYGKTKNFQTAIKYLKDAIKLDSGIPVYHQVLADVYFKNRDFKNSLKEWQEVLKLEPDNAEAAENIKKIQAQF